MLNSAESLDISKESCGLARFTGIEGSPEASSSSVLAIVLSMMSAVCMAAKKKHEEEEEEEVEELEKFYSNLTELLGVNSTLFLFSLTIFGGK